MRKEESKEKLLLEFQSVRGFQLVEEETEEGLLYRVYRGKKPWSVFFGDKGNAISAMYNAYAYTINKVLMESQERIKDPERSMPHNKVESADPQPLLTE